jgi:hypothetical protein
MHLNAIIGATALALVLHGAAAEGAAASEDTDTVELGWMSDDAIRDEFAGQRLAGIYPNLNHWTEAIESDGSTDYHEGIKQWRGHWWVESRAFCFSYPFPGNGGCFRIVKVSSNCFELYDFSTPPGQADAPPAVEDRWNGRMWHADKPTTCEERPAV